MTQSDVAQALCDAYNIVAKAQRTVEAVEGSEDEAFSILTRVGFYLNNQAFALYEHPTEMVDDWIERARL